MPPRILFDRVWKKFRRGDNHDTLRDLVPQLARRFARRQAAGLEQSEFWALRDVSFTVDRGEVLGVIGHNGAGKSTVLKLLTRILRPTGGRTAVHGRVGALIEVAAGFHPDLTGRENVFLQGAIMGMTRPEIGARFDEIIEFAGLERFVDTPVKRYSSGMNARLGFAIAAHLRPDVLLVDEVLAVGDMAFQQRCHERMQRFKREGVAMVFVSHNLTAVAHLCDRTLLLNGGRVESLGRTSDVISAYCRGQLGARHAEASVEAALTRPGQHETPEHVRPGEPLALEVTVTFRRHVERATIGVVVWDVRREWYVYGVSSDSVGIPPIRACAGEQRAYRFDFDAHLARGLYALEVNVFDLDRQEFLISARGIRHFSVAESTTYDGVANLYLRGAERTSGVLGGESAPHIVGL